jgi:hypothetical protein
LLTGLRMWMEWIEDKSGRKEIKELVGTVGKEMQGTASATFIWKPSFVLLQSRNGGRAEIGGRGNVLATLGSERKEWMARGMCLARQIKRMMGWKGGGKRDTATEMDN